MGFLRFFTIQRQLILFGLALLSIIPLYMWAKFAGAWISILVVILFLAKHIVIGTVNSAALKMQEQDLAGARKILSYTWKPSWLRFTFHGMYYFVLSSIEFQDKNYKQSEKLANTAMTLDLQDDYKAMLYLQLINIYGQRKNIPKVKELLKECKKLSVTQEMVQYKIDETEQMLKGTHPSQKKMMGKKAQRSMMNQGYMGRGRGRKRR